MSSSTKFLLSMAAVLVGSLVFFEVIRRTSERVVARRQPSHRAAEGIGKAPARPAEPAAAAPVAGGPAPAAPAAVAPSAPAAPAATAAAPTSSAAVVALYARNCAACHGEKGDGQGIAARFLDPKPRNFRLGFRLVSSSAQPANPSRDDIEAVLERGMPGSSMVSWAHLSPENRRALAEYVLSLRSEGAKEARRLSAKEEGEEASTDDLEDAAKNVMSLGDPLAAPAIAEPTAAQIAHGKEVFIKGCATCHGNDGKGGGVEKMLTTDGYLQRPRDLTLGIYKGHADPLSLYRRIRIGLPGSAMPGLLATTVSDTDVIDLIHFVRSLSDEPAREQWVQKRRQMVARRAAGSDLGLDAKEWGTAEPISLAVAKLWWEPSFRNPELKVSALHDGKQIAIRLNWKDATQNASAYHPEQFEDMVAVQLFQGADEPFLGMGAKDGAIDLWQWRAGWNQPYPQKLAQMDEYPFQKAVGGFTDKKGPPPDFMTARAAGNQNANADRSLSAANLIARGFGSTTFRPKPSQLVAAKSRYADGHWTVILTRPLEAKAEDGISLPVGQNTKVAFAVWDGQAQDRNGQKAITIWHDLKIEP